MSRQKQALWPTELAVSDTVGRLMEFWGFKRNMGRIWAVLYLSPDPLSAEDLRNLLQLSSGAVSMTLSELSRWGVVRKVWVQGERKDFFTAEVQLWRMISRVFNDRERAEIVAAIDAFEGALPELEKLCRSARPGRSAPGPSSSTSASRPCWSLHVSAGACSICCFRPRKSTPSRS